MFDLSQYELIDFGAGRKLERFGAYLLDRPAPAAEDFRRGLPNLWPMADARYERSSGGQGVWHTTGDLDARWTIEGHVGDAAPLVFELKRTNFGHVGLFPEQAQAALWLAEHVRASQPPLRLLHLFAHTGCATLAAAAVGAAVTHVDASASVVAWARRNAELSQLAAAPVRWICEDAPTFVRRELKRGRSYDALVLDPPSYGHGPQGQVWQIDGDLPQLLADCAALTGGRPRCMLLSCHSSGWGPGELAASVATHFDVQSLGASLALRARDGRELAAGVMARWPA